MDRTNSPSVRSGNPLARFLNRVWSIERIRHLRSEPFEIRHFLRDSREVYPFSVRGPVIGAVKPHRMRTPASVFVRKMALCSPREQSNANPLPSGDRRGSPLLRHSNTNRRLCPFKPGRARRSTVLWFQNVVRYPLGEAPGACITD